MQYDSLLITQYVPKLTIFDNFWQFCLLYLILGLACLSSNQGNNKNTSDLGNWIICVGIPCILFIGNFYTCLMVPFVVNLSLGTNFLSLSQRNYMYLTVAMSDSFVWWKLKKKIMNLLEFNLYETLHVKVYQ